MDYKKTLAKAYRMTHKEPATRVTVILIANNHIDYIANCFSSVLAQTYKEIEIILADCGSTDGTTAFLKNAAKKHQLNFISHEQDRTYPALFNRCLEQASGELFIDLSGDDMLHPNRVARQVETFALADEQCGVVFSDAVYVDQEGREIGYHFKENTNYQTVPSGKIFAELLERYIIPTPTMMIHRRVFTKLGGYDATLSYEDFDLWVRSSPYFTYFYDPKPLTYIRKSPNSLSSKKYEKHSAQPYDTLVVCRKALTFCQTERDRQALLKRIQYEMKMCVLFGHHTVADGYVALLKAADLPVSSVRNLIRINKWRIPTHWLKPFIDWLRSKRQTYS